MALFYLISNPTNFRHQRAWLCKSQDKTLGSLIFSSSGMFFGNCEIPARFRCGPVEVLGDTERCSGYLAQRAREYRECGPGGREPV